MECMLRALEDRVHERSFLIGPMGSEVQDMPIPEIGDDDILMRLEYVGVCASELHPWKRGVGGVNGILGHEPVGYAAKVGKNVAHIREGERVTTLGHSCFAEYARVPARNVVLVPDGFPSKDALGDPLSCLVSAADLTPVCLGDSCSVVGLGYMGLLMTNLIALKGAGRIYAIDARAECEEIALRHGADIFLTPERREGYQVDCMKHALRLIAAGKLRLEHLITREFPIEAVDEAFTALISKPHGYIKGVIRL